MCTTHLLLLSLLKTTEKQNRVKPNAHSFKMTSLQQIPTRGFTFFCEGTIGHIMTNESRE